MNSSKLTQIKRAIKKAAPLVRVVRIGAGKHQSLGLYGVGSEAVALALEARGLKRTPLSGSGTSSVDLITLDEAE